MGQVIRIEIPVEVQDKTEALGNITEKLTKMEKAFVKTEKSIEKFNNSKMEVKVDDSAAQHLSDIEEAAEQVDRSSAQVEVGADDNATGILAGVEDRASSLNGTSSEVEISADDNASPVLSGTEDAVARVDGTSAQIEIGADDNATGIINTVQDRLTGLDGTVANVRIRTEEEPVTYRDSRGRLRDSRVRYTRDGSLPPSQSTVWSDSSSDMGGRGSSHSGIAWDAASGIIDTVTAPIGGALNALKSPVMQVSGMMGLSLGVASSVDGFKDFEAEMSKVKAISGASEEEFGMLTEKAKQMGADTKFSAYESAQAFNYMAMAGWKTKDMMSGIEGIMSLAAASGEDLGTTSDIVTDALTAFGLQAGDAAHFSDVLAQASSSSNTTVGMMGESFKYVAPVAGALGYKIEDTSLALGLMANASIKGSMAGTSLKTALANMANPTDSMAEAMKKYGISLTDTYGNMKPLKTVMDDLRSSLGGLSETEQTAAASTIFGKEAMSGMLAIINASEEDYGKLTKAVYNADGAAKRMADTMMNNLAGSFELLSGAADEVQMTLGERLSPYLRSAADALAGEMPYLKGRITQFMDYVDGRADAMKNTIKSMTSSDEWGNADLAGKADIVWNRIVAEPFMNWAGSGGKHMISKGLTSLFSNAMKILPGGESAGLSSWLSAGIIAKAAVPVIERIHDGVGLLSEFAPLAGKAGAAAAIVAAGIAAVAVAVDDYNQKMIESDFAEKFGNIELSQKQMHEFASQMVNSKWIVNIETALGEFKNAESLREQAEAALRENDALEWKSRVNIKLSEEENTLYKENVDTFIENSIKELEAIPHGMNLAIKAVVDKSKSKSMINTLKDWMGDDLAHANQLSSALTSVVENALEDGIIDVNEQGAIDILQEKINNIMTGWGDTSSQTMANMIRLKYGHLTGADLTVDSFKGVVADYQSQRDAAESEITALSEEFYNVINGAHNQGRLSDAEYKEWDTDWTKGVYNRRARTAMDALEFEGNTLRDTYGSEIDTNLTDANARASKGIQNQINTAFAGGTENVNISDLQSYLTAGIQNQMGDASPMLTELYQTMTPDVAALSKVYDQYAEDYGAIPEGVKKAYMDAIQLGAAAGDESAATQMFANNFLENASESAVKAFTDENNPLCKALREAQPEFMKALDRALTETTDEEITLKDMTARLGELDVKSDDAQEIVQQALNDLLADAVVGSGSTAEVEAGGVKVTLGEVEVDQQSALEQIAAAVGVTADALAQANGYENAAEVPVGASIIISPELCDVDASGLISAIEQATKENTEGDSVPTEMEADTTVNAGNVNTEPAVQKAHEETKTAMEEPYSTEGHTDVTLTQTNNADAIYDEVGGQVKNRFAAGFTANASVAVTLDWSITNPNASVSTSSDGGSVHATIVGASAEGRYVDSPMVSLIGEDGPEFVIPVGAKRRSRGMELWQKAGEMLGVPMHAEGGLFGGGGRCYFSDTTENRETGKSAAPVAVPKPEKDGVAVNITINPTFQITNDSPANVVQTIKDCLKEIADELSGEITMRLADAFANTPV